MQPAEKPGRGPWRAAAQALLPWAAAALALAAAVAVFGLRYDTNDDATIANLAAGAYGPDRLHLVYVSAVLGALLRPLYALAPSANWYVLFSLLAMLAAGALLCRLALDRFGTAGGLALFAAGAAAFAPEMVCRIEHIHTTALCAAAGLAWLAARMGRPLKKCWPGIALAWLGSLLRWQMFCAVGGLSAALLLARFFALDKSGRRRAVGTAAVLAALVLAAKTADVAAYRLDAGWRAYSAYNAARTEFSDFKVYRLPYGVNALAAQGVSDTENAVLLAWDFYDGTVFPTARLAALNAAIPARPLAAAALDTLHTLRTLLFGSGAHWALTLALLAGLLLVPWRRSGPFWATAALLGAEVFYLMWRTRWTRYVEVSVLLAAAVFLLAALPRGKLRLPRHRRAVLAAFAAAGLLLSAVRYPALREESAAARAARQAAAAAADAIAADKAHLYLVDVEQSDALAGSDVWHARPEGYFSNIVALGGWLSHAPYCEAQLAAAGLASPLPNAVDAPDVYVFSGHVGLLADFAAEQLGRPVHAEPVPGRASVYRLVSG